MQRPIIECVPNISEGRNLTIIDRIIESINQTEDCSVLGIEPDADYNRTVVTCLLYTSPSPRDTNPSRMPSSA